MVTPADHRVDRLEQALTTLSTEVAAFIRESRADTARLKDAMARDREAWRREMADFKDEMARDREASRREMADFKDEMARDREASRHEMADFKREMADFKDETRRDARRLNRQLGEIAAAQGKLVEDIAAPSVPRVLRSLLGLPEEAELDFFAIRLKLRHPTRSGENAELDVVAAHDKSVFVVEVKAALAPEHVAEHARLLPRVREFLPQFAGFDVLGGVASVYVDASLVTHAERLGLVVLAAGDDLLSIQNTPGFEPRRF